MKSESGFSFAIASQPFKYNNEDTDGHEDNTKGGALCEEVLPSVHYENDNNEERDGKTTKR